MSDKDKQETLPNVYMQTVPLIFFCECVRVCADVPVCVQPKASMEAAATDVLNLLLLKLMNLLVLCCDATLRRSCAAL
jgi:hypothetical protein